MPRFIWLTDLLGRAARLNVDAISMAREPTATEPTSGCKISFTSAEVLRTFVRETVAEVERLTRRETVAGMIAIWLTPRFEVSWPSERLEISQASWRILAARHRQVKSGPNFWTRRQAG